MREMVKELVYQGRAKEKKGVEGVVTVVKVQGFCSWLGSYIVAL